MTATQCRHYVSSCLCRIQKTPLIPYSADRIIDRASQSRYGKRKRKPINYDDKGRDGVDDENESSSKGKGNPTKAPAKGFQYLSLPPEVRAMIYGYAMGGHEHGFYIKSLTSRVTGRQKPVLYAYGDCEVYGTARKRNLKAHYVNVALLKTCKAVRYEGLEALYKQRFNFADLIALQSFVLQLNHTMLGHLRHIDTWSYTRETSRQALVPSILGYLVPSVKLKVLRLSYIPFPELNPHVLGIKTRYQESDLTLADYDILVAKSMGKAAYRHMYPFLAAFLRAKERTESRKRPVEQLLDMLLIFEDCLLPCLRHDHLRVRASLHTIVHPPDNCYHIQTGGERHTWHCCTKVWAPNEVIAAAAWTPERRSAVFLGMGNEIIRLVELDHWLGLAEAEVGS